MVVDGVESTHFELVILGLRRVLSSAPFYFLFMSMISDHLICYNFHYLQIDTVVLYISSLVCTMNEELKLLSQWFKFNKLFLNFYKTRHIIFNTIETDKV